MKISASFLKIQNKQEKIKELNKVTDLMHYDIMDGIFVPNKTIEFEKMQEIDTIITVKKDIHLMVKDIHKYAKMYKKLNPEYIIFHYEATNNILETINYIKLLNTKVGIAINPDTDPMVLKPYLDKIDLILVMSVFPGAGGQKFIDISDKIDYLDNYRKEYNLNYIIEVDGGINDETIKIIKKADVAVIGSFITDSKNYQKQTEKVRNVI